MPIQNTSDVVGGREGQEYHPGITQDYYALCTSEVESEAPPTGKSELHYTEFLQSRTMIRYKLTRITLGDGDLRYHLQRLLARHRRLAEWHQHDQYQNDSSWDEDDEDDAFLESDSDLFSGPSMSPSDSICYSPPDESPQDSSTPRGREDGRIIEREFLPVEASSSSAPTIEPGPPPVIGIIRPCSLSLGLAASAGQGVTVRSEGHLLIAEHGTHLHSEIDVESLPSLGSYVIPEISLFDCLTQLTTVFEGLRRDDFGEDIDGPQSSRTDLHSLDPANSRSPPRQSDSLSLVSFPTRPDTSTVCLTDSVLTIESTQQPEPENLSRTHTALEPAENERGTSSEIRIHPRPLIIMPPVRSTKRVPPGSTDAEQDQRILLLDAMIDRLKAKWHSSRFPTRGPRGMLSLNNAVLSRGSRVVGNHDTDQSSDSMTGAQRGVHSGTDARNLGRIADIGGPKHSQRPTKLVKLNGSNLALDRQPSPEAQRGTDPKPRVPGPSSGFTSCQGSGDPPRTTVDNHQARQENQPPGLDLVVPTALAQSSAPGGGEKPHVSTVSTGQRLSMSTGAPARQRRPQEIHRENLGAALHSIDVEAREFQKCVNAMMLRMLSTSRAEEFEDLEDLETLGE